MQAHQYSRVIYYKQREKIIRFLYLLLYCVSITYLRCKDSASESRTSNLFECYAERSLSYLKIMVRGTKMGQKRAKKRKRLHEDAY